MGEIIEYNNFLSIDDLKYIINYLQSCEWTMQNSTSDGQTINSFAKDIQFKYHECSDIDFFNSKLFNQIVSFLNIKSCDIERIYFNRQSFSESGSFHIDGCEKTVLIYISQYDEDWGGFTQIQTYNNEYKFVIPYQRKLLYFPGNLLHKGFSFSYENCPDRISLAYKLNNVKS